MQEDQKDGPQQDYSENESAKTDECPSENASYYYDDAHGYESFDPKDEEEEDDDDDEEEEEEEEEVETN
jgi:hypothetical protein